MVKSVAPKPSAAMALRLRKTNERPVIGLERFPPVLTRLRCLYASQARRLRAAGRCGASFKGSIGVDGRRKTTRRAASFRAGLRQVSLARSAAARVEPLDVPSAKILRRRWIKMGGKRSKLSPIWRLQAGAMLGLGP
jgi:hypothetical protein